MTNSSEKEKTTRSKSIVSYISQDYSRKVTGKGLFFYTIKPSSIFCVRLASRGTK